MITPNELENRNRETARKWLAECPGSHRIPMYVKLAEEHSAGLVIREDTAYLLTRNWNQAHGDWSLREVPYCPAWQTSYELNKRHKEEILRRRADTPSVTVTSDAGSVAIEADCTLLMFGGGVGNGVHTVWYDCQGETLSLNQEHDRLLGTFRARSVRVFAHDCEDDRGGVVLDREYDDLAMFDVYAVDEDGWKIVRR